MMRREAGHLIATWAATCLILGMVTTPAYANHKGVPHFVSTCLSPSSPGAQYRLNSGGQPGWSREDASEYAYEGAAEGYQWGGGCWNDDNVDESQGDPHKEYWTGGEGGDCSGNTFKTWALDPDAVNMWQTIYWDMLTNYHPPNIVASSYKSGTVQTGADDDKSVYSSDWMDGFASSDHVALIFIQSADWTNSDLMFEAKGEDYGTNFWFETYRGNTAFRHVYRKYWWQPPAVPAPCLTCAIYV